ncbi:hypothetical protein V2J09_021235 [Rumex salicifolius]
MATLNVIAIRDGVAGGENGGFYSPAKEKAANRSAYSCRSAALRRLWKIPSGAARVKLLFFIGLIFAVLLFASRNGSWNPNYDSSDSPSTRGTDAIHVVWSETDPPPDSLKAYLTKIVQSKSQMTHKPNLRFDLNEEDNLNNRFKPIKDLRTDAIFSIDDDVIVPCDTLDFAFSVWQSAPSTMVGFVPRMLRSSKEKSGSTSYEYRGWWSVWWTGRYSMVLSKAAFFHRKYLDIYTNEMPKSILDYVTRERNCEDIAMSLLVANVTGAPPIWVKGKIFEIGSSGISSLKGHNGRRSQCLNDFISLYGTNPLVPSNVKAVNSKREWFW